MAVAGIPFTGNDIELQAGLRAQAVWNALNDAHNWYLWLNDATRGQTLFTSLGIGADWTIISTAASDLGGPSGLWAVSHGSFTPSGANNYFFSAKSLVGTNYAG
jgi:hypothetical protein